MRVQRLLSMVASTGLLASGLGLIAGPSAASSPALAPTTVDYPNGTANGPCDRGTGHSLQDCVDAVADGGTIRLTAQVIDDGASIAHSLTIKGVNPSLHARLTGLSVFTDTASTLDITIEDLSLTAGIETNFDKGSSHSLTIRHVEVGKGSPLARGISVNATAAVSVSIENSFVRTLDLQDDSIGVEVSQAGTSAVSIIGNQVTQHGGNQSSAGIAVDAAGSGTTRVDIDNNSVWDVARSNTGNASGIAVEADDTVDATFNVVGNTVERVFTTGLEQRNGLVSGGHMDLNVFDNIFAHAHRGAGIDLDKGLAGTLTYRGGYNDSFGNKFHDFLDGKPAGAGNRHVDPRFVNATAGNLALKASSPLIDKGLTCSPGGAAEADAARHNRLAGKSVDIGAYEHGSSHALGQVLLGDDGADSLGGTADRDILCGYGGKDLLDGKGGADYLDGGAASDEVIGGTGNDRLYGGDAGDTLCAKDGVHGNDYLNGGPGSDGGLRDSGDTQVSVEHATTC